MKEKQMNDILDRNIDIFINNIAFELEKKHSQLFDNFGFPMFGGTSALYHEQVYFKSYLEHYTRNMINSILKEITDMEALYKLIWPELDCAEIFVGYTNDECEQKYGFEFINPDAKIGYRYVYFHSDEIESLLKKGNVDHITLIEWKNQDEIIGFHYGDGTQANVILLIDLFYELFDDLDETEINTMYDLFITRVAIAVGQAKQMISLTTLPGFTPSYLYQMRLDTVSKLRTEIKNLKCFFVSDPTLKSIETNSKKLIDSYGMKKYFLDNRFENTFVGASDHAKSFMTSEYLYQYFKNNPMFDYTPIVSGYLKSVEQLLDVICRNYLSVNQISEDLSKYTFDDYKVFIRRHRLFKQHFVRDKDCIFNCLDRYRIESRNNLFHKDYFMVWDRVEQIRTNTIFIYVLLINSIESTTLNDDVLGILDMEYEQLFCAIDMHNDKTFAFVLDGKEYTGMSKERRYKGLSFNENGLILNTVVFKKYDYDHEEIIEISRANMPTKIWIVDSCGTKKNRIWPL